MNVTHNYEHLTHSLRVICNYGTNHFKIWLKDATTCLSKTLSWQSGLDSSGCLYCCGWHRPAHSCACSQPVCRQGMAGPSQRVWDLLFMSRVAWTAGLLPKRTFLSTWCLIFVETSPDLLMKWQGERCKRVRKEAERPSEVNTGKSHNLSHSCCILLVKAGHRICLPTSERGHLTSSLEEERIC